MTQLEQRLLGALIGLTRASNGDPALLTADTDRLVLEALRAIDASDEALQALLDRAGAEKARMVPGCMVCAHPCGKSGDYHLSSLQQLEPELRQQKELILSLCRKLALALPPEVPQPELMALLYRSLFSIGEQAFSLSSLRALTEALETILAHLSPIG